MESEEVVQEDGQSPVVVRSSRRASRIAAAAHASSHLIDVVPAASIPATTSLDSNPLHQPITADRAIPTDLTAVSGH